MDSANANVLQENTIMEEGKSNLDDEMRGILAEFMVGVIKFEELVEVGQTFLVRFQQAVEFLRRPSIFESSELVKSIVKANETKRVGAYVEAGCINAYDSTVSVSQLNTSLGNLRDYSLKAKGIVDELQSLMDKAGNALIMNPDDQLDMDSLGSKQEVIASRKLDVAGCASSMAVIYSMVKQDYTMQEKIVSSLNLKSSTSELDSYCKMWMLRPFIIDDIIHQALRQKSAFSCLMVGEGSIQSVILSKEIKYMEYVVLNIPWKSSDDDHLHRGVAMMKHGFAKVGFRFEENIM